MIAGSMGSVGTVTRTPSRIAVDGSAILIAVTLLWIWVSSPSSTMGYTLISDEERQEAIRALPTFTESVF